MSDSGNGTRRYLNRELSRLDFEERVLELAEDRSLPLLERAKFLAIFASNLDEFYMVRVAGLKRQRAAGLSSRSADGLTPKQQLELISEKVRPLVQRHAHAFVDEILPSLEKAGSRVLRWDDLDKVQRKELGELFYEKIFPIITPLAVDPAHPFPYISNLSLNLAAMVRDPSTGNTHFARIKVPPLLPRFIALRDQAGFVPLEDVISSNLDRLFPGMEVLEHHAFRVTRNADLEVNDDGAEDLLEALEEELRRQRFSPAVRLEIEASMAPHILELLMRELEVTEEDVHSLVGPIDLGGLSELYGIDRPELKDEPFVPGTAPELAVADEERPDLFAILRRHDVLLHHPYDSFTTSVQAFIEQAAADPDVLAIKQTLYRTSGDSPIVDTLMEAAEAGKQVMVLVEIKARGDERNNINWAKALERSGCHVVYGLVGLKTHCKLCLVVRQEGERLRRYVHLGTGNYNTVTARLYEDLGLLTADPMLGADVTDLFNSLTGYSRQTDYRSLVVAPHGMRERIISMIRREIDLHSADAPGRIVLKLNHLVDEDIIDALYEASQAGVRVDLVVRTNCALRPGVSGTSENIEVRSILGRFLEHSRIIYFHNGGDEEFYIGSADMMHRNLDRRVEALVRVEAPEITNRLRSILRLALTDNFSTWILDSGGAWKRLSPADGEERVVMQEELMQLAGKRP